MARVRRDVWGLGDGWSDTLFWYAKGVAALKGRALADRTSWRFLAAMHGISANAWRKWGYYDPAVDPAPEPDVIRRFLQQCQHQTWYFLPWHRGYLAAMEAIVRAAIAEQGGPAADWALPYWNYNNPGIARARELPPAFNAPKLPDGTDNALFVPQRYFDGTGSTTLPDWALDQGVLRDEPYFAADGDGVPPGFGGPKTIFHHGGEDMAVNGGLESSPHNGMHGAIGGENPNPQFPGVDIANLGMMSHPATAALDPIFWLHHCNIDRLWSVWRGRGPAAGDPEAYVDPTDEAWLEGPVSRPFVMPTPDGGEWVFAAKDVLDTEALGYTYEDVSDPFPAVTRTTRRLARIGPSVAPQAAEFAVAGRRKSEMIGASDGGVSLTGGVDRARVRLDTPGRARVSASFARRAPGARIDEPDRVFLKLENIRGFNDAAAFEVYVGVPDGEDPKAHPERKAGLVSLFGVQAASVTEGLQAGNGVSQVLEITRIVDDLHLGPGLEVDDLDVRFVPVQGVRPEAGITVGRISLFRQGA